MESATLVYPLRPNEVIFCSLSKPNIPKGPKNIVQGEDLLTPRSTMPAVNP